ncbi:hypothetical protein R2601_04403 [Salipiger bermudensis HTCC2601]|uniref:Uncharacterized protein n=1 Tax=Salipiger bermudensis (strain DSM 26914 / JCM 13377 / KCTC 12554 / HTCC2601) TaxID=314265 RepID=Q0FVW5_SALBH|nr:hypothetical protein R2601_04403 [Salipiger bermudensis HTCC2601]
MPPVRLNSSSMMPLIRKPERTKNRSTPRKPPGRNVPSEVWILRW